MTEAVSVMHDRTNQPVEADVACRIGRGARAWTRLTRPDVLSALLALGHRAGFVRFAGGRAELRA